MAGDLQQLPVTWVSFFYCAGLLPAGTRVAGPLGAPRRTSPHGWGGPGGGGPPLQAQVAVDRAVCRWHIRAQSWVVEREQRDGSLHWRTERRDSQQGSGSSHDTLPAHPSPHCPPPARSNLHHAPITQALWGSSCQTTQPNDDSTKSHRDSE